MLMVDGNVVYNGGAYDSIEYFKKLGMAGYNWLYVFVVEMELF